MTNNIDASKNNAGNLEDYDFLVFSFNQSSSLPLGVQLGGKKGIGFEPNSEKFNELKKEIDTNKFLGRHKLININPLQIKINENNTRRFKFTTCSHFIENLAGINETKLAIYNAIRMSSDFVFISQPNFDSDVTLFKNGFKTNFSDWTVHTNHLTSNILFNILFDYYKMGYIEDFLIFYSSPIKNSNDPVIHPLNSPGNQTEFNIDSHPFKRENVKFKNIYKNLNVIITVKGCKKIDELYEMISDEKNVLYDSRQGIYDNSREELIEPDDDDRRSIFGKMNEFLNSDV